MSVYKDPIYKTRDPADWLAGFWPYPRGIEKRLKKGDVKIPTHGGWLMVLPTEDEKAVEKSVAAALDALKDYADEAVSFPASKLLRSIRRGEIYSPDDCTFPVLLERCDVLGIYLIRGLKPDELFELDREIADRANQSDAVTILMGTGADQFHITIGAYGIRSFNGTKAVRG